MLSKIVEASLSAIRFGSASFFLVVVTCFVFLLLVPRDRRRMYLSITAVRHFVEYFGNVGLGDDGPVVREQGNH
jgi:hypothetical protein